MERLHNFSVIIPCYNVARTIGKLLQVLVRSDYPQDLFEVIVAYDRSTDNTREIIEKYAVVISESTTRSGPSGGRNRGAQAAKNEYLIFLDSDVIPRKETIRKFNQAINSFTGYDVIQAVYADASYKSVFSQYQQSWFSYFYCLRKNYETNILSSSCICVNKDLFLNVGGFNIRKTIPAVEDIDLGYRLLNIGAKILISTDIHVFHDTELSLIGFIKRNYDVHNFMLMNLAYRKKDVRKKNPEYDTPIKNLFISTFILAIILIFTWWRNPIPLVAGFFLAGYQIWLNRKFFNHVSRRTGLFRLFPIYFIFHLDNLVKTAGLCYGICEYYILKKHRNIEAPPGKK